MTLVEPDVALTDFGLAIECAAFAAWLHRGAVSAGPLRAGWTLFFCAIGIAALLGGITHGLISDHDAFPARAIWWATLLAIGLAAFACWVIGGYLLFPRRVARWVTIAAGSLFAVYAAAILLLSPSFLLAVAHYGLAGAFLLAAFVVIYCRRRERNVLLGIAGLILSYAAAAVQQSETAIPALSLSHNALYHVIQAVALLLIFLAARTLTREAAWARDVTS